jgi:hypothetical protein
VCIDITVLVVVVVVAAVGHGRCHGHGHGHGRDGFGGRHSLATRWDDSPIVIVIRLMLGPFASTNDAFASSIMEQYRSFIMQSITSSWIIMIDMQRIVWW